MERAEGSSVGEFGRLIRGPSQQMEETVFANRVGNQFAVAPRCSPIIFRAKRVRLSDFPFAKPDENVTPGLHPETKAE